MSILGILLIVSLTLFSLAVYAAEGKRELLRESVLIGFLNSDHRTQYPMKNFWPRALIFLSIGIVLVISARYTTTHFLSQRQTILLNITRPDFTNLIEAESTQNPSGLEPSMGDYQAYFKLVMKAMPQNSDARLMLGFLDLNQGHFDSAEGLLTQANALDPNFFFTYYNLGWLYYKKGDYVKAAGFLHQALSLDLHQTFAHFDQSIIYRQLFAGMSNSQDVVTDMQKAYTDARELFIDASAKVQGMPSHLNVDDIHAHII